MNTSGQDQVDRASDCPTIADTLEELAVDFHTTVAVLDDGAKCGVQLVPALALGFTESAGTVAHTPNWTLINNVPTGREPMKMALAQEMVTRAFHLGDACTLPLAP